MEALDMVIVGGCGHVGLPLALSLADCGYRVGIDDNDATKVAFVKAGNVPFLENGADALLKKLLPTGRLQLASDPRIVLRSTVFPGTTDSVERRLLAAGIHADVVFCPERVAEGHALEELRTLPQLVGASSDEAFEKASRIFERLGSSTLRTTPLESELAKLLTNTWRYMKFAIANQFFQIAHRSGVDYNHVLDAIRRDYPRAADLPGPGFAAGPCLQKDTMQLSAYTPDHFPMGQAAMQINEGLPNYIVDTLNSRQSLQGRTVGILGMAFKGESDDPRASLSYKLRKLAAFKGARVMCTDPFIEDPSFESLEKVVSESDILVVAAPHHAYKTIDLAGREVVDIWGITGPIRL